MCGLVCQHARQLIVVLRPRQQTAENIHRPVGQGESIYHRVAQNAEFPLDVFQGRAWQQRRSQIGQMLFQRRIMVDQRALLKLPVKRFGFLQQFEVDFSERERGLRLPADGGRNGSRTD